LLNPVALDAVLAPRLEADTYTSATTYDALNRPVTLAMPHTPAMQPSVIRPGYNEANLLERVDANLRGAIAGGQPVWTSFVSNIDYNAKGQRQRIDYGNGASTVYDYDPLTFRLVQLLTRRDAIDFPNDCIQPPPANWPGCQVQNLHYTHDPAGNITRIRDEAQQTVFFSNKRVEPSAEYTYDALYRLIEATGREHLGQIGAAPIPHSHDDAPRVGIDWSANDGAAMGTYVERYVYDAVGNFLEMQHRGSAPVHPGWIRAYAYDEVSLIEDGTGAAPLKTSNRLSSTTVGSNVPPLARYVYDAHGNMIRMPHLGGAHPTPNMHWDYRDQLRQTDLGGGGTAYYVYDSAGQRVRKVWEKSAALVEERIYLGGFEIFRRRQGAQRLERETLHLMDDKQRIALVETRTLDTAGTDPALPQVIRYQFGNHLGSASLELDDQAQIISYEEYTPYGSTSYQAVRNQTETPKRYRYTGKERDEESGLYYHGARYYAPWIGRWTSCDPVRNENLYCFVRSNPLSYFDPDGKDGEEPGFWQKIRQSETVQFLGGVAAGTLSSFVPGGFLIAPVGQGTGVLKEPSRAFQAGYGAGEIATGIADIVTGVGGEIGGGLLDATGVGALVGIPINVASAAVIVQGAGNITAGIGMFSHAMSRSPDDPAPSKSTQQSSESTTKQQPTKTETKSSQSTQTPKQDSKSVASPKKSDPTTSQTAKSTKAETAKTAEGGGGKTGTGSTAKATPKTVREAADELAKKSGGNRVSAQTGGGKQIDIDLAGKGHFDKASGKWIETPHVHQADINVGPSGKTNLSNKTTRPANMNDVRTAKKLLEGKK
jgi:RHS repeat-associated protein